MLTLEEIMNTNVNLEVAKFALCEVEKNIDDALLTKDNLEKRAFTLLAGYVATASFLVAHAMNVSAFFTILGIISLAVSMISREYACKGTHPSFWLNPQTLDTDSAGLAVLIGYEIEYHANGIDASIKSNSRKRLFIDVAIFLGCIAMTALLFSFK